MFPGTHAEATPDRLAVVMGNGDRLTYAELDQRSARLAQYWYSIGLRPDDHVAVLSENQIGFFEVLWAALRSGLQLTPLNWHFSAREIEHVIRDSGAKAIVVTAELAELGASALREVDTCSSRLIMGGAHPAFADYAAAVADQPATRLAEEPRGEFMLYSSGTTGQPKGVRRPLSGRDVRDPVIPFVVRLLDISDRSVTLVPAPLYHAAPIIFSTATHLAGGTLVCMERFDAEQSLALIERHRVTHSQWVPTHFHRLLRLPEEVRDRYDTSSLEVASHTAAPCPPHLKHQMIQWWGPVVYEYYGGTEGNGLTFCDSEQWLAHPGTVGSPVLGIVHICAEDGAEVPVGEKGVVYFETPNLPFRYHNDPEKTASVLHPQHSTWSTLGDIGHLDADGFLYLSDRATFMVVSGGVNIYPQETENVLLEHPQVHDAAVFGLPCDELGEQVVAVVELVKGVEPTPGLDRILIDFVRERIAHYKAPRRIEFAAELPRTPTGKLMKRPLRDAYLAAAGK